MKSEKQGKAPHSFFSLFFLHLTSNILLPTFLLLPSPFSLLPSPILHLPSPILHLPSNFSHFFFSIHLQVTKTIPNDNFSSSTSKEWPSLDRILLYCMCSFLWNCARLIVHLFIHIFGHVAWGQVQEWQGVQHD